MRQEQKGKEENYQADLFTFVRTALRHLFAIQPDRLNKI
jgi:hypothetical protein